MTLNDPESECPIQLKMRFPHDTPDVRMYAFWADHT